VVALAVAIAVLVLLVVLAAIGVGRQRARARTWKRVRPPVAQPRRSPELEARIRTVLVGPRQKFGDIFIDYTVWKTDRETRLELVAGDPWKQLNEFSRCLVVRYLWRVLESLSGGAVVIVDVPEQLWNEEVDSGFRDQGFDWKTFGQGPAFIKEP
jgi:hypothetical protein